VNIQRPEQLVVWGDNA